MAFTKVAGKTKMMYLPVAASVAITSGNLVAFASGTLVHATNTVDSFYIIGVARKTIASTDSDYASAKLIPVEVPVEQNVIYRAPVAQGTLATSSVGLYFDLTTADDGSGIDQSASSLDIALCTKYISATEGYFTLNIGALGKVKA